MQHDPIPPIPTLPPLPDLATLTRDQILADRRCRRILLAAVEQTMPTVGSSRRKKLRRRAAELQQQLATIKAALASVESAVAV